MAVNNGERIYFSNYGDTYSEEDAREFLFGEYGDEEDWETPDDIPDQWVYDEIRLNEDADWDFFRDYFERYINNTPYGLVLSGSVGRWNGRFGGGMFIYDFDDILDFCKDCDYIKVYGKGRHLYIQCSHHDGTNYGELKEITQYGADYKERHSYDYDGEVVDTIFNSSKYSRLPNFSM